MSDRQTENQIQLIPDFEPKDNSGDSILLVNLVGEMDRQGITPYTLLPRAGIFGAKPRTNAIRDEIESRLGIDAVYIYDLSKVRGLALHRNVSQPRMDQPIGRITFIRTLLIQ